MITTADQVYELFFNKLEADEEFFAYYGVDEDEAMLLARERSKSYLREAILFLRRRTELAVDFSMIGDNFVSELTDGEGDLLSEIMLLRYYERGLAKLSPKLNLFSSSELKLLHSPANERTSYVEMVEKFREHIREEISWYQSHDRLTGVRNMVDHTIPSVEEE